MSESSSPSCVKRCCVNGCNKNTRTHPYHSFFRFPVEKERYVKWLEAIDRMDILEKGFQLSSYRVCETHFPRSCISTFVSPSNPRNKQLTRVAKNAVPNLNLPIRGPGETSESKGLDLKASRYERENNSFMLPARRIELKSSTVEIVSIPPDPLFKYKNLTISATNTVDFSLQVSSEPTSYVKLDKSLENFEKTQNITKSDAVIPKKVYSQQTTEGRSLLKRFLLSSNDHSYSDTKDKHCAAVSNLRMGDSEIHTPKVTSELTNQQSTQGRSLLKMNYCISDIRTRSQPSSSQFKYLTTPIFQHSPPYKDNTTKNSYVNLIMKMSKDEESDEDNIGVRINGDDDFNLTKNTSKPVVNIRPVLNNMLELSPEIFKKTEVVEKSDEDEEFSDSDTIGAKTDFDPDSCEETMIVVKTDDDVEMPEVRKCNVQLENVGPKTFLVSGVEIKTEDDDKLSDTICVKEENIEDLIDVSNTELI